MITPKYLNDPVATIAALQQTFVDFIKLRRRVKETNENVVTLRLLAISDTVPGY